MKKYSVEIFIFKTGLFGGFKEKNMVQQLADRLNELDEKGFDIVSVVPLLTDTKNFEYQIIYKQKEQ